MNNKINYIKSAKKAFETYVENPEYNYETCEKIYNFINNFDSLNDEEKKELENFITDNTYDTIYLANLYTNPINKKNLKKQLIRMIPISLSKPTGNIFEANGDFTLYTNRTIEKQPIKIKTYPKKAA
ncbi:MAG: hypothetical protein IKG27_03350 [Bacilli bacterium]|nr:hypothetical protein [Bacilli bacterium]